MNKSLSLDKRAPGSLNIHENKTIRPLLCGMLTPFSRVQCFKCDGKMLAYDIEYCDWLMLLWRGKRILMDNDIICAFWLLIQASWKDFRECPLANSIKQNWQRERTEADSQEECANSKHVTWRTGHTLSPMTRVIPFQGRISSCDAHGDLFTKLIALDYEQVIFEAQTSMLLKPQLWI